MATPARELSVPTVAEDRKIADLWRGDAAPGKVWKEVNLLLKDDARNYRSPYARAVINERGFVKTWQKRMTVFALLVVAGGAAGWLLFNLGLDFLLGGRTFAG
jgi:hypothetical protein